MWKSLLAGIAVIGVTAFAPQKSFGLAALADGAKTSCKPTAPVGSPLYRTQVNCDPLNVLSYQVTLEYDASLVQFVSVAGLNGYSASQVFTGPSITLDDTVSQNATTTLSSVTIAGRFAQGTPPPGENDVFGAVFDLVNPNDPTNYDKPVFFEVLGEPNDFVTSIDTDNNNNPVTFQGSQIAPSTADLTLNQIHGVPEPTAVGLFAIAATMIAAKRKRS